MKLVLGLFLVCLLAPPLITYGGAKATGYEARSTAGDGPRIPKETTGELLAHAVRGCVEVAGSPPTGIQAGVVVARCTPAALPHLGTQPVVAWKGAR